MTKQEIEAKAVELDDKAWAENDPPMPNILPYLIQMAAYAAEHAFKAARAATLQEQGEEKEDHLVDGLKFVHKDFRSYWEGE